MYKTFKNLPTFLEVMYGSRKLIESLGTNYATNIYSQQLRSFDFYRFANKESRKLFSLCL